MEWQAVVALVLLIPVILFPAAFVWYRNVGGAWSAISEARQKWAVRRAAKREEAASRLEMDNAVAVKEQNTDCQS